VGGTEIAEYLEVMPVELWGCGGLMTKNGMIKTSDFL
jgi:hypothetical protein